LKKKERSKFGMVEVLKLGLLDFCNRRLIPCLGMGSVN
jgi:hypothetical protein